jgi:hypothetical protein
MIEESGSFSGNIISPIPHLGPESSNLISSVVFIKLTLTSQPPPRFFIPLNRTITGEYMQFMTSVAQRLIFQY